MKNLSNSPPRAYQTGFLPILREGVESREGLPEEVISKLYLNKQDYPEIMSE